MPTRFGSAELSSFNVKGSLALLTVNIHIRFLWVGSRKGFRATCKREDVSQGRDKTALTASRPWLIAISTSPVMK